MAGPVPGVTGVPPVESMQLAAVSDGSGTRLDARNVITDTMDVAIKNAMQMPAVSTASRPPKNAALPDGAENGAIRDRSLAPDDAYATQIDAITDKFVELYQEMTIFKVTWQIARRTGKDVETLLRAQ